MKLGIIVCVTVSMSVLTQASLSPKVSKHFFEGNQILTGGKPTVEGNLQYLIGKTGVSTYLTLSDENKDFIKEITNIILTDDYVKNIESHRKDKNVPYDIISTGEKDLKTNNLSFFVMKIVSLLKDIEEVRSGVDNQFNRAEKLLNKYQDKRGYNIPNELLAKLNELKPQIENVLNIHNLLDEQELKNTMDFAKKEQVIKDEIVRIKVEIKKNEGIIKGNENKIKKLDAYLKTLERLRKSLGISQ